MQLKTRPPTVLEFEGTGSLRAERAKLPAPPSGTPADRSSEQPAMLGVRSRGPGRKINGQAEGEQARVQPSQAQPLLQRDEGLLAAPELGARATTDLISVWCSAGGLSQGVQPSAEEGSCSIMQPTICTHTDDSDQDCDSFWDIAGMSSNWRGVTASGCSQALGVRHAQSSARDCAMEVRSPWLSMHCSTPG